MNKTYKVYKYTFPNGKVYIGMTSCKTLIERFWGGYKHNPRIQEEIARVGWNGFDKEILYDNLTQAEACELEKQTIREYDSTDPSKGYNVSFGGKETFAGLKHTAEHRQHMSELYKGKEFSKEHIENLKKSHAKERHPVESIDDQGNVIKCYQSLGEAAEDVGGHKTNVTRACKSGRKYKGYLWRYSLGGESH